MEDGKTCCCTIFPLRTGVVLIWGMSFLAACILLIEGVLRGVLLQMTPMIAMYMIFVMLAVLTKTSEARDTFGWRMALFVTFCVLQCFLIKVNAILYIFGIWLDLSDLYCGDANTP